MPIIDAHAHIYPGKIASKAVDAVGDFYCLDRMCGKGTPEDLLEIGSSVGITNYIVHSVATTARSVHSINTYLASECEKHPEFIGFGTMHPEVEDIEAEVEYALSLGLHGFKLHPDTQRVDMDDPRLMKLYEVIEGRVPLVVHTGDYRYGYSSPERLVRIMKAFPNLVIDAAHLAGWSIYDVGYDIVHKSGVPLDNLFMDASSAFTWIGRRHMRELVRMWGPEHVMFGSDYPMWNPAHELNEMMHCEFTDEELELILYKNAERFTGVKVS